MSVKSCEIGKPSGEGSIVFEFLASTKKYKLTLMNSWLSMEYCHDTGSICLNSYIVLCKMSLPLYLFLRMHLQKSENKLSLEGEFVKNYSLINLFFPS